MIYSLEAQTFVVENSDGVEIKYTVTNGDAVGVVSNNYTGRVVVPESVIYDGTTYTVEQVNANAFSASSVQYVELPSTILKFGVMLFNNSTIDTLRLNCPEPPTNLYGITMDATMVKNLFGNPLANEVTVIVPSGHLRQFHYSGWCELPGLTSPTAVPVTLYSPKNTILVMAYTYLKLNPNTSEYFTRNFEVGEKIWLAPYHQNHDTVFMGWDKGDVYLTEITGPDTLRPIYDRVGHNTLDINNVSALVRFTGQLAYMNGEANYFVPAQTTNSPLFSTGLWMGGYNQDISQTALSVNRFSVGDYVPGPLTVDGNYSSDLTTRQAFNRVWTVSRAEIDDFIAHVGTDGYSIPENILSWPGNGGEGYAPQLAPYYDADSNGIYEPQHGDYPLIRGDKMAFSIFNDVCVHSEDGLPPMGMEIHMSAYAFDDPQDTALNNTVFVSYKCINRSGNTYVSSMMGAFADIDLGNAYDDYIGCDVKNGLLYGYNGTASDQQYGAVPPAQGCMILAGPNADQDGQDNAKIDLNKMMTYYPEQLATYQLPSGEYDIPRLTADADLYYPEAWALGHSINGHNYGNGIVDDERLGMSYFVYYENSTSSINGEPMYDYDYANYMQAVWKNGVHIKYGGNGCNIGTTDIDCRFMYPGDSDPLHWGTGGSVPNINPDDWTEITAGNSPGDRRGIQSCGYFTIMPDEVNTLDLAYTTAFGTDNYGSLSLLRTQSGDIRKQFTRDTTNNGTPFTYMPYSPAIVGTSTVPEQPSMKVYPNPAHDLITVALGEGTCTDIEVLNIRGHMVKSLSQAHGLVTIDLSNLPKGVYFVRCGSEVIRLVRL